MQIQMGDMSSYNKLLLSDKTSQQQKAPGLRSVSRVETLVCHIRSKCLQLLLTTVKRGLQPEEEISSQFWSVSIHINNSKMNPHLAMTFFLEGSLGILHNIQIFDAKVLETLISKNFHDSASTC